MNIYSTVTVEKQMKIQDTQSWAIPGKIVPVYELILWGRSIQEG